MAPMAEKRLDSPSSEQPAETRKEVVVSQHALELAKGWLRNMSGGADFNPEDEDDAAMPDPAVRPLRLGLGAKYVPHSQAVASPVAKKLKRQIDTAKRASNDAATNQRESETKDDDDDDDDEAEESRTNAFKMKSQSLDKAVPLQQSSNRKRNKNKKRKNPS